MRFLILHNLLFYFSSSQLFMNKVDICRPKRLRWVSSILRGYSKIGG